MSAILTNTAVATTNTAIVFSVNTKENAKNPVNKISAGAKQWFQQYSEKASSFDWDVYMNELEFE